ncbi:MAG: transcription antitermination factor NusB [Pseudomonadota bacterium]
MSAPRRRPDAETRQRARAAARLAATQALFQMEASGAGLSDVQAEFETHRLGAEIEGAAYEEADLSLFRALLAEAVGRQAEIDQLTDRALVAKWPIDRIDPTLRALFRAAGAELLLARTPPRVAIKEFVDIARAFFPAGRETGFVNAVLDHMARETQPEAFA